MSGNPAFCGTIIGMVIGFGIVGAAVFFFWNRSKSAPKDLLVDFARAHGLSVVDQDATRCEVAGLLRHLHTNIVVTLLPEPALKTKARLPQALGHELRVWSIPMSGGMDFFDRFSMSPEGSATQQIITEPVRRALLDLLSKVQTVEITEDAIVWTGPGATRDIKQLPAIQARVQGIVMALGQR